MEEGEVSKSGSFNLSEFDLSESKNVLNLHKYVSNGNNTCHKMSRTVECCKICKISDKMFAKLRKGDLKQ